MWAKKQMLSCVLSYPKTTTLSLVCMLALSPCSHLISVLTYLDLACTSTLVCRAGTIISNPLEATDLACTITTSIDKKSQGKRELSPPCREGWCLRATRKETSVSPGSRNGQVRRRSGWVSPRGHSDQSRWERPGHDRDPTWSLCKEAETAPALAACLGMGTRRDRGLRTAKHNPQNFMSVELLSLCCQILHPLQLKSLGW